MRESTCAVRHPVPPRRLLCYLERSSLLGLGAQRSFEVTSGLISSTSLSTCCAFALCSPSVRKCPTHDHESDGGWYGPQRASASASYCSMHCRRIGIKSISVKKRVDVSNSAGMSQRRVTHEVVFSQGVKRAQAYPHITCSYCLRILDTSSSQY